MDTLANLLSSPKLAVAVFGPLLVLGLAKGCQDMANRPRRG